MNINDEHMTDHTPGAPAAGDDRAIRAVIGGLVDAWSCGDADAFASGFAADADFYNVFAQHLDGRPAIANHHAQLFDTVYRDTRLSDVDVSVRLIRPDVAVVVMRSVLHVAGEQRPAHALGVVTRDDGRWQIASLQNMAPLVTAA